MLDEATPLFSQIAERLAQQIADGSLAEGQRAPSSNELAAYYRINPATAVKGINLLVDQGLLTKERGIGMFVTAGARERLLQLRRSRFAKDYVEPLVREGLILGLDTNTLIALIHEAVRSQGGNQK